MSAIRSVGSADDGNGVTTVEPAPSDDFAAVLASPQSTAADPAPAAAAAGNAVTGAPVVVSKPGVGPALQDPSLDDDLRAHIRLARGSPGRASRTTTAAAVVPPTSAPAAERNGAAAQPDAARTLEEWLAGGSHDDVQAVVSRLGSVGGADASALVDGLPRDGKLDRFAARMSGSGGWVSKGGLSPDEQRGFLADVSGKLDGAHLAALQRAFAKAGDDHSDDVANAVAAHASPQTRAGFVQSMAAGASDRANYHAHWGSMEVRHSNTDAEAAATVLSSLRGGDAQQGFAALSADQRQAVFNAAGGLKSYSLLSLGAPVTPMDESRPRSFEALLTAAGSIPDPSVRAKVMGQAADAVQAMGRKVDQAALAPLANAALRALDGPTLADMTPDRAAGLAGTAARGLPEDVASTAAGLSSGPPSAARDATVRMLFLKTAGDAYRNAPGLAAAIGLALARTHTGDPATANALGGQYAEMLGTNAGRGLLSDTNVDPQARLWAAGQVAVDRSRCGA